MSQIKREPRNLADYYVMKVFDFTSKIQHMYNLVPKSDMPIFNKRLTIIKQALDGIHIAQLKIRENNSSVVILDPHADLIEMVYRQFSEEDLSEEIFNLGESIEYNIAEIMALVK